MKNTNYIKYNKQYNCKFMTAPAEIFTNDLYKNISSNAKILYINLLNRVSLSLKNHYINKKGLVYIFFTRKEAMELLNCSENTATKSFKELVEADLIEEQEQGVRKANMLFVKMPLSTNENKEAKEKSDKAKKYISQKRKEFLKKINSIIKVKEEKLQKLNSTLRCQYQKIRENKEIILDKKVIANVQKQINVDYLKEFKDTLNLNDNIIDTITLSVAEMYRAKETKINDVIYPKFALSKYVDNINLNTIIELSDNLKNINLHTINNLKSYIKTSLINLSMNCQYQYNF